MSEIPMLRVGVPSNPAERQQYAFQKTFRIGRIEECEVWIKNDFVSRHHAEVAFENGQWRVRDLGSSNGIFVDGVRVENHALPQITTIRLGVEGPFVRLETAAPPPPIQPVFQPAAQPVNPPPGIGSETMVARYTDRYFGNQPAGEHTMMVRKAISRVQTKQKRKYRWIIAAMGLVVIGAGAYSYFLHQEFNKRKALAENLFYTMKSLDLDIANVEKLVTDSHSAKGMAEIQKYQQRRKEMEKNYDQFLSALRVYDPKITPQERLILRVARIFGECELDMPPGFVDEVNNYIKKWQSSGRMAHAVRLAKQNGYAQVIVREMLAADLPPQFFYLAMQESDFDPFISGPMTRMGIAKGMWQFIPQTGVRYGLKMGPLVDFRRPDPGDDRHHYERATKAAAGYLKELYTTDAQASGFLVMACYNWGEDYVLPLVRKLPPNPRDRNFWRLLATSREKIPKETYDYVFYIVSAAVIGENPRLFGFDFDNPLAQLEEAKPSGH